MNNIKENNNIFVKAVDLFRRKRVTKVKRTKGEQVVFAIAFIMILLYSLFLLYHFYFMLQLATKGSSSEFADDYIDNRLASWSPNFTLANFIRAFSSFTVKGFTFPMIVFNSLWYSVGSILINLFFEAAGTYVLCKYKFKGRMFIYNLIIIRMMIPIYGSLPSTVRVYKALGIVNSPLILITATDCFGSGFLIMYAFFKAVSWEYAEAAFIDGASHWQVYFKIMLPMAMPAISVVMITGFIGRWNEYMAIAIYMPKLPTLAYAIYIFQETQKYENDMPVYFSGIVIASIPCIILFLIFQNSIMQKVHIGGLKG